MQKYIVSKSTFVEENLIYNKFKKGPKLTSLTFDNSKYDKENQASIKFNNSLFLKSKIGPLGK